MNNIPEVPNFITLLSETYLKHSSSLHFIHIIENSIFSIIIICVVSLIIFIYFRKFSVTPGKFQNFVEFIVEKLRGTVCEILGEKNGNTYFPYIGSLFIFILLNNLLGLIPLLKSPTSSIKTTAALAILTFLYVQYSGIRRNGLFRYLHNLSGSPAGYF